ncbi:MAG TPA: hypothetical protein VLQ80_23140 [Candidatus Saccharimonadia bacterium]|nr:hypothetical protein [Candidatus Saccharimonadia bacterium]
MLHQSKILIVDDEPFNVDYLEQELSSWTKIFIYIIIFVLIDT